MQKFVPKNVDHLVFACYHICILDDIKVKFGVKDGERII